MNEANTGFATSGVPGPPDSAEAASPDLIGEERYSRQRDLVPMARLSTCQAMVIGVGAIGRQVALQLAAIGIPYLSLVDPDTVEVANLAAQGYLEGNLGQYKVMATSEQCHAVNSDLTIDVQPKRFQRSMG